jgi:succinate dehydrogenase/fumarate reductase flavoprotein subunit
MGGNSTKATSGINGAGTQTQLEQGIPDSAKTFFEDTKKSVRMAQRHPVCVNSTFTQARELARDDLIRVLTGRSGDAVNWLQDRFALDLSKVARLGGHSQPRTHRGDAQFPGMVRTISPYPSLFSPAASRRLPTRSSSALRTLRRACPTVSKSKRRLA